MSDKCHFRTNCIVAKKPLFDHLVGAGKQHRGHSDAQCLGGLEIDDELKFIGLVLGGGRAFRQRRAARTEYSCHRRNRDRSVPG
jgi:hypothetical protein